MTAPELSGLQFFDKQQDYSVAWKRLPHWAQAGTVCFITWRTADSLLEEVLVNSFRPILTPKSDGPKTLISRNALASGS